MGNENGLHFSDVGKGEPALVLLHYFGGSSQSWSRVITALGNKFRCIAIDLPGFGDSPEALKLSVSEFAIAVDQVIKALALQRYVLVGHSMGGKIALFLAATRPPALLSLVLVAPSPPTPEPIDDKERKQMLESYGNRVALENQLNTITARPLSRFDTENTIEDNLRSSHDSWNWWTMLGSREDISPQVSTVSVPALIISGEKDPKFSSSFLKDIFTKYPQVVLFEEIKDAGHLLPIEAPEAVAKLLCEWVKHPGN